MELLEQHPPDIKYFKKDKLFYILSLIHEIPARNKRNGMSENGYTNLNSTLLQKFIYEYRNYLDYLIFHDVIKCNNRYKPGERSKGYRLRQEYKGQVIFATIQNPVLIRKLKGYKWETSTTKNYIYLKKWMDGLEIDFNSALDHIQTQYAYRMHHPEAREWDFKKNRYKDPVEQYNSANINIYYLKDKRFYFFVDPNVGRLHTNLTNIQSDLRNFITWKGQKLTSIDISNSQPYLSSKLFSPSFYEQPEKLRNGPQISFLSFYNNLSNYNKSTSNNYLPSLMLGISLQLTGKQDVKLYTSLVEKGLLYEHLAEAFKTELGLAFSNRKNIKAAIFQLLFTDNRFIGQKEAAPKRIFKRLFPNVYELLAVLKKGDPTILPRLLQQMEVKLILDIICERISKRKPHIPIFTIHDSITTTMDNLTYVQRVMREELTNYIGISPKLKLDYWTPEKIDVNKRVTNNKDGFAA